VFYYKLHLLDNIRNDRKNRQGMNNIQFTHTDLDLLFMNSILIATKILIINKSQYYFCHVEWP